MGAFSKDLKKKIINKRYKRGHVFDDFDFLSTVIGAIWEKFLLIEIFRPLGGGGGGGGGKFPGKGGNFQILQKKNRQS